MIEFKLSDLNINFLLEKLSNEFDFEEFNGFYKCNTGEFFFKEKVFKKTLQKISDSKSEHFRIGITTGKQSSISIHYKTFFTINYYDSNDNKNYISNESFFFELYKSLPNGLGYVSWVDVGNYYKFDSKYGLNQFEFYDSVFNEKPLFYHCVTTKEVYEEDHSKEQLLNCPFIKVEEWEDGSIEMLHYNNPLEIESEETIEQIRRVRKYLSENNLYS